MITTQIKLPTDCSPAELDAFEKLVCAGGEVTLAGLRQRICSASLLLFLYDSSGTLAGVSALKRPTYIYRYKVFRQAHASVSPLSYRVELGWVFDPPSHQGQRFSRPLVELLLHKAMGSLVFATTRVNNEPMQRTLARYGFRRNGGVYHSTRGDYDLALFIQ